MCIRDSMVRGSKSTGIWYWKKNWPSDYSYWVFKGRLHKWLFWYRYYFEYQLYKCSILYPLKFGKFTILAGINVGAPLSAIESYSSGGTNKVAVEELNIDYGALMGVSYGINDKYGVRLFLHYGFAELWIEPQEGQRLTTIIGGACIYYNLWIPRSTENNATKEIIWATGL